MNQLTPDECRVLGVLVEKAHTVASQYPMSLNAIVTGCNQKSNRHPVLNLNEDRVVGALDGLRAKGLVLFAETLHSRVMKYKHNTREALGVDTRELVILTELLLRGPQTLGELRGRASRMHALDSLEDVRNTLAAMMGRPEPLVRQVPPLPGSRAERYAQLLCPDLHPLDAPAGEAGPGLAAPAPGAGDPDVLQRLQDVEEEVARLRQAVRRLAESLGENDLLP